jgi:hypothetical protein
METKMHDNDLLEGVIHLQTLFWIAGFMVSIYLTGGEHWKNSCTPLRIGVALWNAACIAQAIITLDAPPYEIFPWGFSWFYAVTPLVIVVSVTTVLWYCHKALSELNSKNNRRSSKLLERKASQKATSPSSITQD